MNIVWHEVRKIWNIKILVIVLIICGLYFLLNDVGSAMRFLQNTATDEIYAELTRRHGTTVTYEEMDTFVRDFGAELSARGNENLYNRLNWLYGHFDAAESWLTIRSSQYFFEWERQIYIDALAADNVPAFAAGLMNVWRENGHEFAGEKYNSLRFLYFIADYYAEALPLRLARDIERMNASELTDRQRERMTEILYAGEYRGTLPGGVFWNTVDIFRNLTLILVIASLILHGTLLSNDKVRNIVPLQFSAILGRRILLRQFAATMLSSVLLTTAVLAVTGVWFGLAGVLMYWNHGLMSFVYFFDIPSWAATHFPMTFGNYLLILAAMAYALSLGTAAAAFIISRFSKNLIAVVIATVPVFAALVWLHALVFPVMWQSEHPKYMTAPLGLWNNLYFRTGFAYMDMFLIAAFAVIAVLSAGYVAGREIRKKRRDLL